ncbi:MAG: hypothetical protein IKF64_03675 [Eubacterium sp.]|nr:hypothetical protein [Eubacterium sp.]
MKKTLSLVLSLVMIITSLAALPFTAQAADIMKVDLNYYFDNGDVMNFNPSTEGLDYTVTSVDW